MQTAFQSNAFQNNAFQIASGTTGADSWPGDTGDTYKKKRHKQLHIGRGQQEYDEILNEITARLNGTFGIDASEEEIEEAINAVSSERIEKKPDPISPAKAARLRIVGRVAAAILEERLQFQAILHAEIQASLQEEDDEEVMLLI